MMHGKNLVAILGTTISPYLFFWQASQEVEEEKAMGRRLLVQRQGATRKEIVDRKLDVGVGTFFSNFAMYFIILTTAIVLHKNGITKIETSRQAAEALGMSLRHFQRHVQPHLRCVYSGQLRLYPKSELQRWIDENTCEGGQAA